MRHKRFFEIKNADIMFEQVEAAPNSFDEIGPSSKNSSSMLVPSSLGGLPYEFPTESLVYGITMAKNAATYTATKIYEYEWRENFAHMSKEISENVFPRPKDPRLTFMEAHPNFADRAKISESIIKQHPNSVPLILERADFSRLMPLKKKKLIVPKSYNAGDLTFTIRNLIPGLNSYEAVIMMVMQYGGDGALCRTSMLTPNSSTVSELYSINKSGDGFLYINIKEENVFG